MPMLAITSNKNSLNPIHYYITNDLLGVGNSSTSDRWSRVHKKTLRISYDIAKKAMCENKNYQHAVFHSGAQWKLIDEELKNLNIRPKDSLIIEFSIISIESPDIPLVTQIMTYPKIEAIGCGLLLTGLLTLTTALIALIPAVATALAAISISSAAIAIAGGILFAVGMTLSLASYFCHQKLTNASFIPEVDVTMEQVDFPESRKSFTPQAKKTIFAQLFPMNKVKISPTFEEVIDEEMEAGLSLGH